MPTPVKLPAVVAEIVEHAPDLRSFLLTPERRAPRFRPGQFLHLAIDPYDPSSHWPESRVFSIASSPDASDRLRVTVSLKGAFTRRIFEELRTGSRVWVKLPFGSFCPEVSRDQPAVFVAGGTGVTPFVSFVEWAASRQPEGLVAVHYAAREPGLLVYREQLEACRGRWPRLRLACYAESLAEAREGVRPGRIPLEEVWSSLEERGSARFYLSGPRAMIDGARATLLALGAEPGALLTDEWG
jgi:ferredoxin-NADP reductase